MIVIRDDKMLAPSMATGIEKPSTFIDQRSPGAGSIAKATGVETVLILVDLLAGSAGWTEVLDPQDPEPLGSEVRKIALMDKAEGTRESEVPPKTGAVGLVTEAAIRLCRLVPPFNDDVRREGSGRENFHSGPV